MKTIDTTKLEKVLEKPDKTTARCPACAKSGRDRKGDHLVIYPEGKFGCAVHPDDKQHRKEILELVGVDNGFAGGPRPVEIKRPTCAVREPRRLFTLSMSPMSRRVPVRSEVDEEWAEYLRDSVFDPSHNDMPAAAT